MRERMIFLVKCTEPVCRWAKAFVVFACHICCFLGVERESPGLWSSTLSQSHKSHDGQTRRLDEAVKDISVGANRTCTSAQAVMIVVSVVLSHAVICITDAQRQL